MQVQKQIDELLALRASEWFELLPRATAKQLQQFEAWLCESRLHVQEFLEIAEIEFSLTRLDPQRRLDVENLLGRLAPRVPALPPRAAAGPFSSPRKKWGGWLVGISAAASLVIAIASLWIVNGSSHYRTSIGEQRVVELADASVITLNADSQIKVRLEESRREIDLHGEALFQVAHDTLRPFRVHTRAGFVQAVGTQFNVQERVNGDTRVSVLEGKVRAVSTSGQTLLLSAGQEADVRLDGSIEPRQHAMVANTVAWRQHRLVFDSAPLDEIAAEFNRYNQTVHLRLEGLEGDKHRFDGSFDSTDPQSLIEMLSREPDLVIEHRGANIVIRAR